LHIGEQISLLVDLTEQRTRTLYPRGLFAGAPPRFDITGRGASPKQVVISPVSNSELRDWGIANYARLIALLLDRVDCRVVLVGSGAQHRQLERILEENGRARITNVAGASDWFGTAEIVRAANLVIANNSGVAHLAAACGTPSLAIYSGCPQPQGWGTRW